MKKAAPGIVFIALFVVLYSFYLYAQENGGQTPPASLGEQGPLPLPKNTDTPSPAEETNVQPVEGTGKIQTLNGASPVPPVPPKAAEQPALVPAEGTLLKGAEGTTPSQAPSQPPPQPVMGYVGMDACRECHDTSYQSWIVTPHGKWKLPLSPEDKKSNLQTSRIDCESCHGPGSLHAKNPEDKTSIIRFGKNTSLSSSEQNSVCLRCHNKGNTLFWKASVHEDSLPCGECHRLMKQVSGKNLLTRETEEEICFSCHLPVKAKMTRSPHKFESVGTGSCRQCHNPHGTATDKMLKAPSVNESCYGCHAEKRGPFLFEHFPVTENCLLCHDPHGSFQKYLLTVRQPYLCLDCHTNLPASHDPFNPESRFTYNRACINCHPQIHGSNHPSGTRLQR